MKHREALIALGLGFGDEGKGSTVDYLARQFDTPPIVVRFNGGPQAAHNVVLPDGRHHTFASFGSGTFVPGVRTHLSQHVLVNPIALFAEEAHLSALGVTDALQRLTIHADCKIITPYHKAVNRARENARTDRHGSCGHGVGEVMLQDQEHPELTLRARNLTQPGLQKIRSYCRDLVVEIDPESPELVVFGDIDVYDSTLAAYHDLVDGRIADRRIVDDGWEAKHLMQNNLIFEGAQGVLLDEWHGMHPYTTWSTTTFENALEILTGYTGKITKVGVSRTYLTRHGPGPFPTEDPNLAVSEPHNGKNPWQGAWRVGWPDLALQRYAIGVCGGIDKMVVTHADVTTALLEKGPLKVCTGYENLSLSVGQKNDLPSQEVMTKALFDAVPIYEETDDPFVMLDGHHLASASYGPTWEDRT